MASCREHGVRRRVALVTGPLITGLCAIAVFSTGVAARDNGQYANSPLKDWFNGLASSKGVCCSFADGLSIQDVDWDTQGGSYRVRLEGQWIAVPDAAVVKVPNKLGRAVVWPYKDFQGATQIRCFLPGGGV